MNTRPHLRLLDGPLVDNQSLRTAMVERMANDLMQAGTAGSESAAMRSLRDCGHAMPDIVMLIDDARQAAMQDIVARDMVKP